MSLWNKLTAWFRSSPALAMVVVVLVAWGWSAHAPQTALVQDEQPGVQGRDVQLYARVTARVADGEEYYSVLAEELPARGFASGSVFNFRFPTLTWLNAVLPTPEWSQGLLTLVAFSVVMGWIVLLQREVPSGTTAGILVLVVSLGGVLMNNAAYLHEAWAGIIISGALASWGLERVRLSVGLGALAFTIRELSLLFVVIMAAMAWQERRRKEAVAWAGVALLCGGLWAWHAARVQAMIPPGAVTGSWLVLGGWNFALATSQANPLLLTLPHWLTAVLVPVSWAGFWSWRTTIGNRLAFVVTGYLGCFMVAGRPENWYWGFLISPLLGLGVLGYVLQSQKPGGRAMAAEG